MPTIVAFAGDLADDPELLHTPDKEPFVICRVLVGNRVRNSDGGWVDAQPTEHRVEVFGTAALNLYDSAGRGDRILVYGLMRTEAWTDRDSQQQTTHVVEVSDRFGEVGGSFRFVTARIDRQRLSTEPATSAESGTDAASG